MTNIVHIADMAELDAHIFSDMAELTEAAYVDLELGNDVVEKLQNP